MADPLLRALISLYCLTTGEGLETTVKAEPLLTDTSCKQTLGHNPSYTNSSCLTSSSTHLFEVDK